MILITKLFVLIVLFSFILSSCGSSEKHIEERIKENRIKAVPHGVVQFYGQIKNIDEENLSSFVRIDSVIGIGAGVKPVVKGDVLLFTFNEDQKTFLINYYQKRENHLFEMANLNYGRETDGKIVWKLNRLNF